MNNGSFVLAMMVLFFVVAVVCLSLVFTSINGELVAECVLEHTHLPDPRDVCEAKVRLGKYDPR